MGERKNKKIANTFKFKGTHRDSGSIKLIFFPGELIQKPIIYWANIGSVPKNNKLPKVVKAVNKIVDNPWSNNITYLSYYSGARVEFPFHVYWQGTSFEFRVYNCFGDGPGVFSFSRKVKNKSARFTKDEIDQINNCLRNEYHRVWDGYRTLKDLIPEFKDYSDLRAKLKNVTYQPPQTL